MTTTSSLAAGVALAHDTVTGRLTGTSYGSVTTARGFDGYGSVASEDAAIAGTVRLGFTRDFDARARIARLVETNALASISTVVTTTTAYDYDAAGRLTGAWEASGDVTATACRASGTQREQYTYANNATHDRPNGHRTAWTVDGVAWTASYDPLDRPTSVTQTGGTSPGTTAYTYTALGARETATLPDASVVTYAWDVGGALTSVAHPGDPTVSYVLDPQGRWIGRKVGGALERGWLYVGQQPVAEVAADGHTVTRVFVYGTAGHVPDAVLVRPSGAADDVAWDRYRVLTDHAGSVRAVVGVGGTVVQRMRYTAFGVVREDWHASGWDPLPFGYAGGLYDRATGLVRFGARAYDPSVGRWLSRDPISFSGGDSNVYAYCGNDPVNWIDATGLAETRPSGLGTIQSLVSDINVHHLETISNFVGGFGDAASFGASALVRNAMGIGGEVNQCSGSYMAGMVAGTVAAAVITSGANEEAAIAGAAGRGRMTTLYRAVSEAELHDVAATGRLRGGAAAMSNKWFAETAEHATAWGRLFFQSDGQAFWTMRIQVPESVADQMMRMQRLDGIGPARSAAGDVLDLVNEHGLFDVLSANLIR